ncbi:MAG: exodeoxyribonuclease V subunit alpha [Victivallales bacterium]|nr:exodeoxyribonuclease V subunit alpha [Victivallales bacterium]
MSSLQECFNSRELTPLERSFGEMIARRTGGDVPDPDDLKLLAAMTLAAVRSSDSCLDLQRWSARPSGNPDCLPSPFSPEEWLAKCQRWGEAIAVEQDGLVPKTPLVLCGQRVYLQKYRVAEHRVRAFVRQALAKPSPDGMPSKDEIHNGCGYFARHSFDEDRQQQAVKMALSNHFSIVTGGPGTGKTTVLSVILRHELTRNSSLKVSLCAPTGKAAARMTEAIAAEITSGNLTGLDESTRQRLASLKASTIHSLVGLYDEDTNLPKFNDQNQLSADLVVVDECSMCSLMLLSQLIGALKPEARLLLLGDKDQLASVESGVVFGDLCRWAEASHPLNITYLTESHRFNSASALGRFVLATVGRGDNPPDYVSLYTPNDEFWAQELDPRLKESELVGILAGLFAKMGLDRKAWRMRVRGEAELQRMVRIAYNRTEQVKVLCALRQGMLGVVNMNKVIASLLNMRPQEDGTPVLVLRNDPVTGLHNGDTGVWFRGKIWFPEPPKTDIDAALPPNDNPDAGEYWNRHFTAFSEALLPEHETAFAMTIHKSQGSGYQNVIVTLPFQDNPILTRELVYTAMTRTREKCFLLATRELLENAVKRPTERSTGLQELLREDDRAEGGFAPAAAISEGSSSEN